jgi:hypothetical protein
MGLAADLARALDPAALWQQARSGCPPDPWQCQVLRSRAPRVLLNGCRQSGKSSVAACVALETALYAPGSLVLLVSSSLRQSGELFRKVLDGYEALEKPVAADTESTLKLALANGSRIVSLPTKEGTIRGFSGVDLLLLDEASRIPDALYYACRPMLAVSGGRLLALSTPFGKRGWWFEAWTTGEDWERVQIDAYQCPRISPAFLEEERRSLPDWVFRQEYLCQFVETLDQVFCYDDVLGALDPALTPLFPLGDLQDVHPFSASELFPGT